MSGDNHCAEEFQHADPFIALFHIEAVHIFIHLDGVTDALFQVCLTELLPFRRKLRILSKQRHKVPGKGSGSALGLGTDNEFRRDLHQSQVNACGSPFPGDDVVKRRKTGLYACVYTGTVLLLPQFQCVTVIRFRHEIAPFILDYGLKHIAPNSALF